jgi:sulfofructose kinase
MKLTKEINIKPNLILIDGQELEASKKVLLDNPNAISIIDAGRIKPEVIELAKMVDYVVCSKDFAEEFAKIKIDLKDKEVLDRVFNKLEKNFKNVIITVEENGTLYKKDNEVKLVPTIGVKEVDSTGAGDIFHGAFAYCLLRKYDLEKSIKIANIAGAISVTRLGGRYSMPSLKEVMSTYKKCLK